LQRLTNEGVNVADGRVVRPTRFRYVRAALHGFRG
jgi:hypothetical protein